MAITAAREADHSLSLF